MQIHRKYDAPASFLGNLSTKQMEQKAAHRAACGWITHDEPVRFTNGKVVQADSIFEEVRAINRQGN